MTASHSERLLEKQEARVSAARNALQNAECALLEELREYERIRAQYAKETKVRENGTGHRSRVIHGGASADSPSEKASPA